MDIKEQNFIKDERIEELTKNYVWIDIKKFCALKGISRATFFNKEYKNIQIKKIKRKTYVKVLLKKINFNKYTFINKKNELIIFSNS